MYEMKDFQDASLMMQYLNELPPHEVITCIFDQNSYWRVIVKLEPTEPTEEAPKNKGGRPKGSKNAKS